MMRVRTLGTATLMLFHFGCVRRGDYDHAVEDAQKAHQEAQACSAREQQKLAEEERVRQSLRADLEQTGKLVDERDSQLSDATISAHNLEASLEESKAMNEHIRSDLQRLGTSVDQLIHEKGDVSHLLEEAKARLAELSRAQSAAEARIERAQHTYDQLKSLAAHGGITVTQRAGRITLMVPSNQLFANGGVELSPASARLLQNVAAALLTLPGRSFQVGGHVVETDALPPPVPVPRKPAGELHASPASPWDKSARRAVLVVRALVRLGISPSALSAAGFGSYDPLPRSAGGSPQVGDDRLEIAVVAETMDAQPPAHP